MQFRLWRAAAFVSPIHLLYIRPICLLRIPNAQRKKLSNSNVMEQDDEDNVLYQV